jgi:hypothetical protein
MSTNSTSFKVGRGAAFYMFMFLAVGGVLMGAGMAALREWLAGAAILTSGVLATMICIWMPGVLTLDDSGPSGPAPPL